MSRAFSATPLTAREAARLLTRWGFTQVRRGNGSGHTVYVKDGCRVQIPGLGRHMPVTWPILRKAAAVVDVTVEQFLAGPTKMAD